LPDERLRSIHWAREFLRELLDPKKTPRVPKIIRSTARNVLKHYPTDYDMERVLRGDKTVLSAKAHALALIKRHK
jgi:hypothetical protein